MIRNYTKKNCDLSLCVSASLREIKSNTTTSVSNGRCRCGLRRNTENKENGDTEGFMEYWKLVQFSLVLRTFVYVKVLHICVKDA